MFGILLPAFPPSSVRSDSDAMAEIVMASAIDIVARRTFTFISLRFRYRVDLVSRDELSPNGVRGATFRAVVEDPKSGEPTVVIFTLPARYVRQAQHGMTTPSNSYIS